MCIDRNNNGFCLACNCCGAGYFRSSYCGAGQHLVCNRSGEYSAWYYYLTYERLQKILNYDTTSSVTNIIGMFYYCNKLTEIPLIDTSQVKLMNYTFYYCENLINFPQLDTSKVTGMIYTFYGCKKLVTISQLDTSNVASLSNTFAGCSSLETIPQLNTSKVSSMYNTFQSCYKLRKIDITHMSSSTGDTWGFASRGIGKA